MLIACWSSKGGAGTTVVACGLALHLAGTAPLGALVVDLAGDVPTVLGMTGPDVPGVTDWLASPEAGPAALARLEHAVAPGLGVVCAGGGDLAAGAGRADRLVDVLGADPRHVVVDCGTVGAGGPAVAAAVAAGASRSLLVLRPCFVALRRATTVAVRPSGVVLVREEGRVLGRRDVEDVLGVPVLVEVDADPAVARAVDAGLLATRLPRSLARAARAAA